MELVVVWVPGLPEINYPIQESPEVKKIGPLHFPTVWVQINQNMHKKIIKGSLSRVIYFENLCI